MEYINYSEFKEGVDCSYEIGIWSELNSFMEYNSDKIAKYKNNYLKSEEKYLVEINLKNYCKEDALGLFHKIAVFLEYNYLTIYTKQFFEELGNSLPKRRAFRLWLSDQLSDNSKEVESFIQEAFKNPAIIQFWKDELLISVLLSEYSESFFRSNQKYQYS